MSVRRLFVALAGSALAVLLAAPAWATCVTESFDRVVQRSDTVWWGTVTDAAVSGRDAPGTWTLTVHLDGVLKGRGVQGATVLVFVSGCGPPITPEMAKDEAAQFLGQTQLFIGDHDKSRLVAFSELLSPQGLSPRQQYERALADLGLPTPSPSPGAPPFPAIASGRFPWIGVTVAIAILITGAAILIFRAQSRERRGGLLFLGGADAAANHRRLRYSALIAREAFGRARSWSWCRTYRRGEDRSTRRTPTRKRGRRVRG